MARSLCFRGTATRLLAPAGGAPLQGDTAEHEKNYCVSGVPRDRPGPPQHENGAWEMVLV